MTRRTDDDGSGVERGDSGSGIVDDAPLVPDGPYIVRYDHHETGEFWGQPKVRVVFEILAPPEHSGTRLERHYNVDRLNGGPRRYGAVYVSRKRDIFREYSRVLGPRLGLSGFSPAWIRDLEILAKVRTTTHDHKGSPLPENCRYSVIDELLSDLTASNEDKFAEHETQHHESNEDIGARVGGEREGKERKS